MKRKRWRLALLFIPFVGLGAFLLLLEGGAEGSPFEQPKDFKSLTQKVISSTYEVNCFGNWSGTAWGIELDDDFYLVTAQHVIEDCMDGSRIYARNSQVRMFDIELVSYDGRFWTDGYSEFRDIALLRSSKAIPVLQPDFESPQIGQWVAASGFPAESDFTSNFSLTTGRVTALGDAGVITTDAAINGGNSGGPLISSHGRVLGTVFAGEDGPEYENMGYVQGMVLHCKVVFACDAERLSNSVTREFLRFPGQKE